MPPKVKLHNKTGKAKSFPKSALNNAAPSSSLSSTSSANARAVEVNNVADGEAERRFEVELCWCIQQLETSLSNKGLNPKQAAESMQVLGVLKNNSQAVVRKRQLMRQHFGDYRAKMAKEEKKAKKVNNQITFSDAASSSKSTFLRKSAFLTTGDNSFRFDFKPPVEESATKASDTQVTAIDVTKDDNITHDNVDQKFEKLSFTNGEFKFNFDIGNND